MLLLHVLIVSQDLPLGISRYSGAGYKVNANKSENCGQILLLYSTEDISKEVVKLLKPEEVNLDISDNRAQTPTQCSQLFASRYMSRKHKVEARRNSNQQNESARGLYFALTITTEQPRDSGFPPAHSHERSVASFRFYQRVLVEYYQGFQFRLFTVIAVILQSGTCTGNTCSR